MIRLLLSASLLLTLLSVTFGQESFHRGATLMGCRFDLTVVAPDSIIAAEYIELAIGEIQRIERLISSWDPASQTSAINQAAGKEAVVVDPELVGLINRAISLSKLTSGAFDISYASMDRIWKFDGSMQKMPTPVAIQQSVDLVDYKNIIIDQNNSSVFLRKPGMKIGFGAIGKGYAADRARALLEAQGVTAGIINASGDLTAWGNQPSGEDWLVAITNPLDKSKAFSWLPVKNGAVVTSGNYEKFVRFNGVRYAHIIDPRTGYPATGILSVTVFAPKAELADALATSIFVMGVETGLDFVNQLPGIECVIIDEANKMHVSNQLQLKQP